MATSTLTADHDGHVRNSVTSRPRDYIDFTVIIPRRRRRRRRRRLGTNRMQSVSEWLDELDRHREDDGRVLFGGDLSERLQVAQLQRRLRLVDDVGSLFERPRSLHFTLRRYHLQQQYTPNDASNSIRWRRRLRTCSCCISGIFVFLKSCRFRLFYLLLYIITGPPTHSVGDQTIVTVGGVCRL